ncbi:MAG: AAA family ATPase [Anaerolineaceae bacterium 4572_78]|nr:MAG: AAA family ATPase [Anaerolineaceae bacterium 4572_78]
MQLKITNNIDLLLAVFPEHIRDTIMLTGEIDNLIEVVLDLGRVPCAYFDKGEVVISGNEINQSDIDGVVTRLGKFMGDNRAGIERTLHRISCIRNRQNKIIGLTCRVGRAIYGTIDIVQDLFETGKSILILGKPGVGKTTLLREAARILAQTKRVVVVDTSNEIAGDGDIPHPGIGRARRMQVQSPELQHHVMIEAVENHTPEVIIIDEIGRIEEAEAARTIAERGVQLIGTAHGNSLDNLTVNPTLADLVGGIESVTLSDDEARRRGTQKTVLERKSPPTFDILIEIQERDVLTVHHDVAEAVDNLLRNKPFSVETRQRDDEGQISIKQEIGNKPNMKENYKSRQRNSISNGRDSDVHYVDKSIGQSFDLEPENMAELQPLQSVNAYVYGANQGRLRTTVKALRVPLVLVDNLENADIIITLKSQYRRKPPPIIKAEENNMPLYILRSNTMPQMQSCLIDIFSLLPEQVDSLAVAMREARDAIRKILNGAKSVELSPQSARVRKKQHEMARRSNLISHSHGHDPQRRVRIYRH